MSHPWTLTAELQRRIQAMEMRCYHKILCILYKDHVTSEEVHAKIQHAIGLQEDLLTIVKRQTAVVWSCLLFIRSDQNHLARHSERGKMAGMDRPRVRQIPEGSGEQGKMEETGCKITCGAPTTLVVKGWMMMMKKRPPLMFSNAVIL